MESSEGSRARRAERHEGGAGGLGRAREGSQGMECPEGSEGREPPNRARGLGGLGGLGAAGEQGFRSYRSCKINLSLFRGVHGRAAQWLAKTALLCPDLNPDAAPRPELRTPNGPERAEAGPDDDSIGDGPIRAGSEPYCGVNGVVWASGRGAPAVCPQNSVESPRTPTRRIVSWPGRPRAVRGQRAGRECYPVLSGLIQRRPLYGSASDPPSCVRICGGHRHTP